MNAYHTPVLLQESVDCLLSVSNGTYVDGTLGGGGHAEEIVHRLSPEGRLICFDIDEDAIATASERLSNFGSRITIIPANFRNIRQTLFHRGIERVNGILLDLGVSSYQLNEPTRGFSFQADERLDMRMDRSQQLDAHNVVNQYSEHELTDILWKYGEERQSKKIAHTITRTRIHNPINTTLELANIIRGAIRGTFQTKTLARVFQAIRIEVNQELENLRMVLQDGIQLLQHQGRFVVISYHSLEDRIVKDVFRTFTQTSNPVVHPIVPPVPKQPIVKIITKKPVIASSSEMQQNPRARSAKMRVVEKI